MFQSKGQDNHLRRLADFYTGKSVLLTGAAGFIGAVLLETLLRCCPGIKSIFILLRSKKNVNPETRKEHIFNRKIFEKLKEETPELLKKVHVIVGDVSLPKLDLNEEDLQLLLDEVSVVFHCAAVINFIKPPLFTLINNVLGVSNVIELCKRMKKLDALVYTSTAYCNSNFPNLRIKEEIHRLPVHSEKFLHALKNEDSEMLQELITRCKPDWPNSYTFSKCLAENVIMDTASDLPVAIMRPSIVVSTWKHPIPGYVDGNSGLTALSLGAGKGFIKVIHADPHCKVNLVPVDIVANSLVLAAWSVGTKRCVSPWVVNCTATKNLDVDLCEYNESLLNVLREVPLPQSFEQLSRTIMVRYKYLYYILAAYYHYIPAIILDCGLKIAGKKPRLYSLYRFLDAIMSSMNFFMFSQFKFERKNMEFLNKIIHIDDREYLDLDFRHATVHQMALSLPEASLFYDWKIDRKTKLERQKTIKKRHMLIKVIQWMFLMTCCLLIYGTFSMIFR